MSFSGVWDKDKHAEGWHYQDFARVVYSTTAPTDPYPGMFWVDTSGGEFLPLSLSSRISNGFHSVITRFRGIFKRIRAWFGK